MISLERGLCLAIPRRRFLTLGGAAVAGIALDFFPGSKNVAYAQAPLSREVTEYGRLGNPRGNVEFVWMLFIPQGEEGSEPVDWRRGMQVIYEMGMVFYQRELRGQFNPDLRIIDPVRGARRFNQYVKIEEVWDEARVSPSLPPVTPGKFRVITTFISVKPESRVGAPLGRNMSYGWGGFASVYALYLSEERRQDVEAGPIATWHENTHAWFNMPHSWEDRDISGGDSTYREDAKNLMAAGILYDDTYKTLMSKEIIDPQKRKINVDPATPVPALYSRRLFLPFMAR